MSPTLTKKIFDDVEPAAVVVGRIYGVGTVQCAKECSPR